jgi:ABC-type sugar transport system ATPase subunit
MRVATSRPVLELHDVTKTFPGSRALDCVSLSINRGETHALVGQNGSGKSTLVKILAGYHEADPGYRAVLNGETFDLKHPMPHQQDALRFVHQDLGLFLELDAVENLALRAEFTRRAGAFVNWRAQRAIAADLIAQYDSSLDLRRPLGEATPVQRTVVAIASALANWGNPDHGLLVLDEPTAVLPPGEVDKLLETVQQVCAQGTSVIYVSHRLDEIFRVADRVTVLRGGQVVATRPVAGLDTQLLAELMVGPNVDASYRADIKPDPDAKVVLRARNIVSRYARNVEVDLREGEVLGLAGLPGSGSVDLPYILAGYDDNSSGEMQLGGSPWTSVRRARSFGIPIVPADRAREGLVAEFSVGENLSLSVLNRFRRAGWLSRRAERKLVKSWATRLEVKKNSENDAITSLSGGNQQKVLIARCLARDPSVIVMCEPTAGVDVGTRQAIYDFIAGRAQAGLSVIVTSSDIQELCSLCTRILVFTDGRVSRELTGESIKERAVLNAMEGETV